jgi:hypothetical protein
MKIIRGLAAFSILILVMSFIAAALRCRVDRSRGLALIMRPSSPALDDAVGSRPRRLARMPNAPPDGLHHTASNERSK